MSTEVPLEGLEVAAYTLLRPDRSRPGHGLMLRAADLEPYRVA